MSGRKIEVGALYRFALQTTKGGHRPNSVIRPDGSLVAVAETQKDACDFMLELNKLQRACNGVYC
jgi:hypothetical protein